ncbi:MAG: Piwi domain-containing protein, partial [Candidatus Jordarchaeaceae archaeon]
LFIIKDQPYSIKSYYSDYLRLPDIANSIDDNDYVIEVDEGLRSGFYASSFCKLIVRTDEIPYEDRPKLRPEIFLKPDSRLKLTEKFLEIISPLYHNQVGEISFDSKMLSSSLIAEGTINSPFISFHEKDVQINYDEYGHFFKSNLKTFGPKIRKAFPPTRQIVLVHPEYMPDTLARTFYLDICKIAKLYFKMVLPSRPILWRYPELNIEDHFNHYKNKAGAVLFIVKDEYDAENYHQFKRIFQDVPNQAVTYNLINLKWSAKNDSERSLYRNALINITSGLLVKIGTRPWLLRDRLSCNIYVGIDVGGLTAKVLNLVVMDDRGNYLFDSWKPLSGIKASKEDIKSFIRQVLHKFPTISQIMIHKDGELFEEEIGGVINAVKEHSRPISLIFVAVKKNVPFRIYKQVNNSFHNTPLGAYFIFNENAALIATTGEPILKQGMARPLLIEIDRTSSKYDILNVLKDIYYLSFMHWGSLVAKTKLPATIKYADDLAGYAEHGIRAPSPPL